MHCVFKGNKTHGLSLCMLLNLTALGGRNYWASTFIAFFSQRIFGNQMILLLLHLCILRNQRSQCCLQSCIVCSDIVSDFLSWLNRGVLGCGCILVSDKICFFFQQTQRSNFATRKFLANWVDQSQATGAMFQHKMEGCAASFVWELIRTCRLHALNSMACGLESLDGLIC